MKRFFRFMTLLAMIFLLKQVSTYAAVTPLSLPKSWNASVGQKSYTTALGCTLSGLGSDYADAPKLKFDSSGDYLLIQLADAPDKLSFNIKGYSTSGKYSFKIQESTDGQSFTDVLNITSVSTKTVAEKMSSLKPSTRYVKFLYAVKDAGNIGIGGISITKYASDERYVVTFDGNGHGTPVSLSLQESSAGSGVILPGCTPHEGYAFDGWSTSSNAASADAGEAGTLFTPSENTTLYACYVPVYTLRVVQPQLGGSLTVMSDTTPLSDGAIVRSGTSLTCQVSDIPEGQRFSCFHIYWDSGEESCETENPFTFSDMSLPGITECTISVVYQALNQYTINYMVNGINISPQENVWEGSNLLFPTPNSIKEKVFCGWIEKEIDGTIDDEPSFVSTDGLRASENKTYYAVFANITPGPSIIVSDILNRALTGSEKSTYETWTGKTDKSDAVYAGNSAGSYSSIQINESKGTSGIVSTISGGKIKKVSVAWNANTINGRTLNIYGKNTAYKTASELYNNATRGTLLGTLVYGTSNVLSVSKDYDYVGVRSDDGAIYLNNITFEWETKSPDTYSSYCTSIIDGNIKFIATDGKAYYATFSSVDNVVVPKLTEVSGELAQVSAFTIGVNGNKLVFNNLSDGCSDGENWFLPANTGYLLKCEYPGLTSPSIPYTTEVSSLGNVNTSFNELIPCTSAGVFISEDNTKYYKLAYGDNVNKQELGFYWGADNGGAFKVKAGVAVLAVPQHISPVRGFSFDFSDDETIIDNAEINASDSEVFYNLSGQRMNKKQKGLNIINGRKVLY